MKELPVWKLHKRLRYEPDTGLIYWRDGLRAGRRALSTPSKQGYLCGSVTIEGEVYQLRASRVAFALYYGRWPKDQVDHRDGDRENNKIKNLRPSTSTINNRNRALDRRNKSGTAGVHFMTGKRVWRAYLSTKYLGIFATKREAIAAREAAQAACPGYTKRHGKA